MRVALVAIPEVGHVQRARPLIADLASHGVEVHALTGSRFRREVEDAGATYVDLFDAYPLDAADDQTIPFSSRYVSHAAVFAEDVIGLLEELQPSLVIHDMFALVAQVAARRLGIPYVNVCAGHNVHPDVMRPVADKDARNLIGPACHRAVEVLRERYGVENASPSSYLSDLSPHLNLYCEPRQFLTEAERESFEPVAFFGSQRSLDDIAAREHAGANGHFADGDGPRVYASFGTVIWRYWPDIALETLGSIAAAIEAVPGAQGLISLGWHDPGPAAQDALRSPNVAVERYVDQWQVLREADAFFTHHGLNSTHEAIFNRVPMGSFPFFGDQPQLAKQCRGFGIAVPLRESRKPAPASPDQAGAVLDELIASRDSMLESVDEARGWELETIEARPAIVDRLLSLAEATVA
jgi:MGT family glycosyltransferase